MTSQFKHIVLSKEESRNKKQTKITLWFMICNQKSTFIVDTKDYGENIQIINHRHGDEK